MRKKEITEKAVAGLEKLYPDAVCSLNYTDAYQLLIATRLSAQCTDKRVNMVTPALFAEFPTPETLAAADIKRVEELIKTCGLYKTKAKDLCGIGKMLTEQYGGKVPDTIDGLTRLPRIGRKTANLIVGDIYGKESIVVDTHMIRISNRIGLVTDKDPKKIEFALKKIIPADEGSDFCHRIVLFGRDICSARKPKCDECPMEFNCKKVGVK